MTALALGAFIGFVWMAHRSVRNARSAPVSFRTPADGALAHAMHRLRNGEITAEEYARIAAILRA